MPPVRIKSMLLMSHWTLPKGNCQACRANWTTLKGHSKLRLTPCQILTTLTLKTQSLRLISQIAPLFPMYKPLTTQLKLKWQNLLLPPMFKTGMSPSMPALNSVPLRLTYRPLMTQSRLTLPSVHLRLTSRLEMTPSKLPLLPEPSQPTSPLQLQDSRLPLTSGLLQRMLRLLMMPWRLPLPQPKPVLPLLRMKSETQQGGSLQLITPFRRCQHQLPQLTLQLLTWTTCRSFPTTCLRMLQPSLLQMLESPSPSSALRVEIPSTSKCSWHRMQLILSPSSSERMALQ